MRGLRLHVAFVLSTFLLITQARVIFNRQTSSIPVVEAQTITYSEPAALSSSPAQPQTNVTQSVLEKRQCLKQSDGEYVCDFLWPTMSEMITRLRDVADLGRVVPENHHYFYTNNRRPTINEGGGQRKDYEIHVGWCAQWMEAMDISAINWREGVNPVWLKEQRDFINENWDLMESGTNVGQLEEDYDIKKRDDADVAFIWCFLQAYCWSTLNPDVYLFTQKGEPFKPGYVWDNVEFWVLTRNTNVQRIWRVDPSPGCHQGVGDKILLWDRSRGDKEAEVKWVCPVKDQQDRTARGIEPRGTGPTPKSLDLLHSRSSLRKRQCVEREIDIAPFVEWDCDYLFPTSNQIKARMLDTEHEGRLTAENSAYFYTNLRFPTQEELEAEGFDVDEEPWEQARELQFRWCEGWLRHNGVTSFNNLNVVNPSWFDGQNEWVEDFYDTMETAPYPPLVALPGMLQEGDTVRDKVDASWIFIGCFLETMVRETINPDVYLFTTAGSEWRPDSVWARQEYGGLTRNERVQRIWRVDPSPDLDGSWCPRPRELLWSRERGDPHPPIEWDCPVVQKGS